MNYALLLSVLTVVRHRAYIGATVVTVPVAAVAYVQWGLAVSFTL